METTVTLIHSIKGKLPIRQVYKEGILKESKNTYENYYPQITKETERILIVIDFESDEKIEPSVIQMSFPGEYIFIEKDRDWLEDYDRQYIVEDNNQNKDILNKIIKQLLKIKLRADFHNICLPFEQMKEQYDNKIEGKGRK